MIASFDKSKKQFVVKYNVSDDEFIIDKLNVKWNKETNTFTLNGQRVIKDQNNNTLMTSMYNENGDLEGEMIEYYDDPKSRQNIVKTTVNWVNNKKEGIEISKYPSGNFKSQGRWKEGIRDGAWYTFFDSKHNDGEPFEATIQSYKMGVKHGKFIEWYEDTGKIISEEVYKNGILE